MIILCNGTSKSNQKNWFHIPPGTVKEKIKHGYILCPVSNPRAKPLIPLAARSTAGSATFRWLALRFRITPLAWTSVSSEYCVLAGRGLCDGPIVVQRRPTKCVIQCDQVQK